MNQESWRHDERGILPHRFYTGKKVKLPCVPNRPNRLGSVKMPCDVTLKGHLGVLVRDPDIWQNLVSAVNQ